MKSNIIKYMLAKEIIIKLQNLYLKKGINFNFRWWWKITDNIDEDC